MSDLEEKAFEILQAEHFDLQTKFRLVDDWLFKSLSVAYIPFLGLMIIPYANPQYRAAFLTVPFLSCLGVVVHSVFLSHYLFCDSYGRYLERKLNLLLKTDQIKRSKYGEIFFTSKLSIPFLSSSIALGIVLLINIMLSPSIGEVRSNILNQHIGLPFFLAFGLRNFWLLHLGFLIAIVGILGFGHWNSLVRVRRLERE